MNPEKKDRLFEGTVVSDKMDKTRVVVVRRTKTYPKYLKQYATRKKYKVHDPRNEYHTGDVVIFREIRPISRDKRWQFVSKVKTSNAKSKEI
jgi:small subunit ribosomal protein S17